MAAHAPPSAVDRQAGLAMVLDALAAHPEVKGALVVDREGRVLASFGTGRKLPAPARTLALAGEAALEAASEAKGERIVVDAPGSRLVVLKATSDAFLVAITSAAHPADQDLDELSLARWAVARVLAAPGGPSPLSR